MVGTVIGVVLIVIGLEGTRRLSREYERSIKRAYYSLQQHSALALAKKDSGEPAPILPFR